MTIADNPIHFRQVYNFNSFIELSKIDVLMTFSD